MKALNYLLALCFAALACAEAPVNPNHKREQLSTVSGAVVAPSSYVAALPLAAPSIQSGLGLAYASAFEYSAPLTPADSTTSHVAISRTVPYPVLHPVPYTVTRPVPVAQPYAVLVPKPVPVSVPQPVAVDVPRLYPVPVHKPYPIAVPRIVPVSVPHPVAVAVPSPYPVPASQPYAVPVVTPVAAVTPSGSVFRFGSSSAQLSENSIGAPLGAATGAPYGTLSTPLLGNTFNPCRGVAHAFGGSRPEAFLLNKLHGSHCKSLGGY